jgi:hypothetical protein
MFVARRPRGAKPQVKGAQGPAGRPNLMAVRPHFESVQAGTLWLHSHVGLDGDPIPESQWKLGGVAGRPRGWLPGGPSPPNRLS